MFAQYMNKIKLGVLHQFSWGTLKKIVNQPEMRKVSNLRKWSAPFWRFCVNRACSCGLA